MSETEFSVPHYDVTLSGPNVNDTIVKLIQKLRDWDSKNIKFKMYAGTSNQLVGCYITDNDEIIIVRRFSCTKETLQNCGQSVVKNNFEFVDRERELFWMKFLNFHKLSPKIYCTFNNGYCHGYIDGETLNLDDLKNVQMAKRCIKVIAKLHNVPVEQPNHFGELFRIIRFYMTSKPNSFNRIDLTERYEFHKGKLSNIIQEVDSLQAIIQNYASEEMVLCHNDISSANLVYNFKMGTLHLIDYEFCFVNHPAYDIGNFFAEFAGVDGSEYQRYPDQEFQKWWIKEYLQERKITQGLSDIDMNIKINKFYFQVNLFALVSHLFWGSWAILQAHFSKDNNDYYLGYAIRRMEEYYSRKEEFVNLK